MKTLTKKQKKQIINEGTIIDHSFYFRGRGSNYDNQLIYFAGQLYNYIKPLNFLENIYENNCSDWGLDESPIYLYTIDEIKKKYNITD